ncbi:MAG TPA: M23 family metallopeptidase [Peptococcaceae bacterium]|nr:M23 family metallopeptidase [Peptococcaceae bacterium]
MGGLWEPTDKPFFRSDRRKLWPLSQQWEQRERWQRIGRQSVAALFIFLLVWGIFQFNSPVMAQVQRTIRSWFTLDYDMEPVLRFIGEVGIWGDTLERAAFEVTSIPGDIGNFTIPVSGRIGTPFGWVVKPDNTRYFHDGISIIAAEGTPVKAAIGGTVTRVANEENLGRVVVICSEGGVITRYAHCKELFVDLNEEVQAGQVIAKVGKTGKSASYPQLFFSVSVKGQSVDPAQLFLQAGNRI